LTTQLRSYLHRSRADFAILSIEADELDRLPFEGEKTMTFETEILSLGHALHEAALAARTAIDAIPDTVSVDDEVAMIDAASADAFALAERIAGRPARGAFDVAVKAQAAAWLDGRYWGKAQAA
jgi:hypothetical protein